MRNTLAMMLVLLGALSGSAIAQTSPEQRQALLDYQLTLARANQLIDAMDEMTKYVVSLPNAKERMAKTAKMTPAEQLAQMEQDPKAMAIVKVHGLTARDYLVGVPALRMALIAAQGGPAAQAVTVSPDNLVFAKANLAQLKPRMDAADGLRSK